MSAADPSPAPRAFASDLIRRVATAAVALPLLAAVLAWGPPEATLVVVAAALLIALREFQALVAARGLPPRPIPAVVLTAMAFVGAAPLWPLPNPIPVIALVCLGGLVAGKGDLERRVAGAAVTLLGALYLGGLGGTLAALRVLPPVEAGSWRLVLLLAVIMVSDTAAYFVGSAFGRHPLAPAISPGKTVEGAVAGLGGGVVAALAVRALGLPTLPLAHAVALGAATAAFGILGDLAESALKRWAGVKDAGRLFPGHGGMLDRLDGLLFGAPVLYYYFFGY